MCSAHIEYAKMFWEEFKYRHSLYWQLFLWFSLAILFLLALPFAYADKIKDINNFVFLCPTFSIVLSCIGSWLLAAEYLRMHGVYDRYKSHLGNLHTSIPDHPPINKLLKRNIGMTVSGAFLVGYVGLAVLELWVIGHHMYAYIAASIAVAILSVLFKTSKNANPAA